MLKSFLLWAVSLTHARSVRPTREPCHLLLLVVHPDDEVIFAGEALLGQRLRLNCHASWHVVVVAPAPDREKEFWDVLSLTRSLTRAKSITGELWNFTDCNYVTCERFLSTESIEDRVREVLGRQKWHMVITHNPQGEYLHLQHIGLNRVVQGIFSTEPELVGGARLFVFNPMPELNATMSWQKTRLLQRYMDHRPTLARHLTFSALRTYTEHLVPALRFSRPSSFTLQYSHQLQKETKFYYLVSLSTIQPSLSDAYAEISTYLRQSWADACSLDMKYLDTCRLLRQEALQWQMTQPWEQLLSSALRAGRKPIRCVGPRAVGLFGRIQAWEAEIETEGGWLEFIVLRPLHVGWQQAHQTSYKILGTSGAFLVQGGVQHLQVKQLQAIEVQPEDLLGWGIFPLEPKLRTAAAGERCNVCHEGVCSFDYAPAESTLHVRDLRATLEAVQRPRRRKRFPVLDALDLSDYVHPNSTYEELLTRRQRLDSPKLGIFEDKIRLRKELLPAAGVLATPSIHLSNDDFHIIDLIRGRRDYVVKPSHMSESQNVFVVKDGLDLLRMAWGHPPQADVEAIQEAVNRFSQSTALKWECRALVSSKPGVIVEELVLATRDGKALVDEYKFYTSWGVTIFAENIPFSSGTMMEISREGHVLMSKAACPPACVAPCFPRMVEMAEKVASHARTDFLRVDILIRGNCDGLYVSEVELFPASDFSQVLKDAVAQRWRQGYGF